MNIVFAGTPEFAAVALRALLADGFTVRLVLSQPDRPAGRGMQLQMSAVKQMALEHGIEVFQPLSLKKDPAAVERLRALPTDVMVVAAYGLILPQSVLDLPSQGCLNIHASLLPRWRGAAPIARAIEAGDAESGVCIMRMEAGLDTGPVLLREALPIADSDTAVTLHDKLAAQGARLIVDALRRLGDLKPQEQAAEGITYAAKIEKAEAQLDFRLPAAQLARKIRAFDPFPGTTAVIRGATLKIWSAVPVGASGAAPGTILTADAEGVIVACGESSALALTLLQKPGGKRLPVREFLNSCPLTAGQCFDLPAQP
ncbi:MAG: methionyl-tRNA formyltransferase [Betaproteobacteria bacterium]|nr:methionyl-tRNA formyltransferase [Betaproteobacteria bacterium]